MASVGSIVVGVDTHRNVHVAVIADQVGRTLECRAFPVDPAGYRQLLTWARRHGPIAVVGIEGAGSWGVGSTRALQSAGLNVVEILRPERRERRLRGKSDPIDADAAARAALNGTASGQPKTRNGHVEAIRALMSARSGAVKTRTAAGHQLRALVVAGPADLGVDLEQRAAPNSPRSAPACARLPSATPVLAATKTAMRSAARRLQQLHAEIADLDRHIRALVTAVGARLLERPGVGVPDKRKTYCLYEAPSADAIQRAAARPGIPADEVTEVVGRLLPDSTANVWQQA